MNKLNTYIIYLLHLLQRKRENYTNLFFKERHPELERKLRNSLKDINKKYPSVDIYNNIQSRISWRINKVHASFVYNEAQKNEIILFTWELKDFPINKKELNNF